ncbi:MAG: ABC transporter permease subunit [Chitinivibrionales bacterium]|nr:ABC transporter permease subunit [Chitinivibrionales bacterium]
MRRKLAIIMGSGATLCFVLTPFLWMFVVSLSTDPRALFAEELNLTLTNYREVLSSRSLHFGSYCLNSIGISLGASVIVTVVASLAGYAVSRFSFPGRISLPLIILALSMFPQICIVGYLYQIFSTAGLINTWIALILPYCAMTIPLSLWINMSYFAQIPRDLDKAGLIDGAGRLAVFVHIILPLALPGIFSSFLLVFITCFNEFLFALMLTIDYHAQTIPVGLASFEGLHGEVPWGNLMAASTMAALPLVVLALVFQRYIINGLTAGALKG